MQQSLGEVRLQRVRRAEAIDADAVVPLRAQGALVPEEVDLHRRRTLREDLLSRVRRVAVEVDQDRDPIAGHAPDDGADRRGADIGEVVERTLDALAERAGITFANAVRERLEPVAIDAFPELQRQVHHRMGAEVRRDEADAQSLPWRDGCGRSRHGGGRPRIARPALRGAKLRQRRRGDGEQRERIDRAERFAGLVPRIGTGFDRRVDFGMQSGQSVPVAQMLAAMREHRHRVQVARAQLQRALPCRIRVRVVLLLGTGGADVQLDRQVIRQPPRGLAEAGLGGREIAGSLVREAAAYPDRGGDVAADREQSLVDRRRLAKGFALEQHAGEVAECIGMLRGRAEHPAEAGFRAGAIAERLPHEAEIVEQTGMIRRRCQCALVLCARRLQFAAIPVQVAEVKARLRAVRRERDCAAPRRFGCHRIARAQDLAQPVPRRDVGRRAIDGGAAGLNRGHRRGRMTGCHGTGGRGLQPAVALLEAASAAAGARSVAGRR